ncbi:MAG: phosphoribosylaminoimidazolesuccinocarboxamide synthase [Bifidobacterium adolescentis]
MEKLEKLYEGKAKQLYATDDPEVLWVEYKNSATAGDGEKKEDFAGKGRLNNLITTHDLRPAQEARHRQPPGGKRVGETCQLVQARCTMFPLEIVLRNTAAGHFCSRLGVEEGMRAQGAGA